MIVSALQLKAARAMLDLSREEFAVAAGLGVNTIRNIEGGNISPRAATNRAIQHAIEDAGLELLEDDGIKRRNDLVKIYRSENDCDLFFDDIIQTIRKRGGDIAIVISSPAALDWLFGASSPFNPDRFGELSAIADVKCLTSEMPILPFAISAFQFRMTARQNIERFPCFVYGDTYVTIDVDSPKPFLARFKIPCTARSYANQFRDVWKNGQKIFIPETRCRRAST